MPEGFLFGVIEGFFGRSWSWAARAAWAPFLASVSGGLYVYAPKNNRALRREWREPLDAETMSALLQLRQTYRDCGVGFGVGLTPFDVQRGLSVEDERALAHKLSQLNELDLDVLAVLFDDMRGDIPGLAASQLAVLHRVHDASNARRLVMCPTYYSDDPTLERVFGTRPGGYWAELGRGLNPEVGVFWTGPEVCSDAVTPEHLEAVHARFGRPVWLWDNYPVNDAERLVGRLHLEGIGRRGAYLARSTAAHLMNPMNQPYLSRIAVATMARAYRDGLGGAETGGALSEIGNLANKALARLLIRDAARFAEPGLSSLDEQERAELIHRYSAIDDPMAAEVVGWLNEEYAFDPACLTD